MTPGVSLILWSPSISNDMSHWNVVHRDTQNDRRIPFSGRFDITIVGRGNRL